MSLSHSQVVCSGADSTFLEQSQRSEAGELAFEKIDTPQCRRFSSTAKAEEEVKQNEATLSTSTLSDSPSVPDLPNKEPSIPISIQINLSPQKVPQNQLLSFFSFFSGIEEKLGSHLSKMMKCDKYIRMATSVIKTYRAYQPKNRFVRLYKELIICRQVIRWESKYETTIELAEEQLTLSSKVFKIFQLFGDFADLISFWLTTLFRGTNKHEHLIEHLDQLESNCYFIECCINFFKYTMAFFKLRFFGKGQGDAKKRNENGWKAVKYLLDVVTSYNNSSLKKELGQVNHKVAGYFTVISSVIGLFLMWR